MNPLSLMDELLMKLSLKKTPPSSRTNSTTRVPSEKSKLSCNQGKLCDAEIRCDTTANSQPPATEQHTINSIADSTNSTTNCSTFNSLADSTASSSANFISNANSSLSPECYRPTDKENLSVWRKDANSNRQHEQMRSQMKNHRAIAPRSKCPSAGDLCKAPSYFTRLHSVGHPGVATVL